MRLAVVGISKGPRENLLKRLAFIFQQLHPDRVVYLSRHPIAQALGEPFEGVDFWERAAAVAPQGTSEQILKLVAERAIWQRAKQIESLAENGIATDMLKCGFVQIVESKKTLSKDDMTSSSVVVFGNSPRPVIQRLGNRLLVAPGPSSRPDGGMVLLSDSRKGTHVQLFDPSGRCVRSATLVSSSAQAQLTVKGD